MTQLLSRRGVSLNRLSPLQRRCYHWSYQAASYPQQL